MRPRRLPRTSASAAALALLLAAGCTGSGAPRDVPAPHATAPAVVPAASVSPDPAALRPYYAQRLSWRNCGTSGFQCATLRAPLDYARPGGAQIRLAVARVKATGPGKRLGSLLVNPGGPGGSAVGYLQGYAGLAYPAPVRARYDMVALDPRGVARSEPVRCLDGPDMDAHTQVDPTPDDRRETDLLAASFKRFASACAKRSGRILPHVSTVEAARDMDVLRAVLGDGKLTYVGASYGTFLGATYAELFPSRTGRLVLDGAMDPSLTAARLNLDQTAGFDTAFRAFAADCLTHPDCPLGTTSVRDATARMRAFLARLDRAPVPTGQDRPLGEALATIGAITAMYDEAAWPQLRTALTHAMDGEGSGLLALADSYYERDGDGGYSNLMPANAAVNCLDQPPAFTTPAAVAAAVPSFEKASPVFGRGLAWASLTCAYWPAKATGAPHRITAEGAPPIVVVGTTRDPATPYKWARSLAAQLSSGVLLTYDGDGHTAYGRGSDCVDTAINTYLLEGTPPPPSQRCRQS
ncbi:alpha/beta hydrolase [Streptomyces roseolilacinus]|uniref:Proteinase n=1 Tax=Streptomyces roseolilacinus TaxID=66904 RepID=A0A918B4W1_9ACTN|nr:alpha/beta hydrolase [Streptomyces roseolilacinus]GGQ28412.1 proteinase [Streptomyces roseolilacinus]